MARLQETIEGCKAFTNPFLDINNRQKSLSMAGEVLLKHFKCGFFRVLRQSIVDSFILYPLSSPSTHSSHIDLQSHDNKMIYCHCMWTDSRSAWHIITWTTNLISTNGLPNIVLAMCSSAGFNISRWLYQQIVCWFGFRVKGMGWRWNGPAIQTLTQYANCWHHTQQNRKLLL